MSYQEIIRASEIGDYVYCARSWWLRRVAGMSPAGQSRRQRGVAMHVRHGRAVRISGLLLVCAGCIFGLALIMFWLV